MIENYLPLPELWELQQNPRIARGLKMVSHQWVTVEGAPLRCVPHYLPDSEKIQWVGFIEVVFERDETNDDSY
jgi:hypothetical protein